MSIGGLLAATSAWSVSLSPDAERLVYVSDRDGWPRLVTCDLNGESERTLDTGADPVQEARFSHDGEWIAFTTAPGGSPRTQCWAVRPDGTELHVLSRAPEGAAYLGPWTHRSSVVALAHTTDPPHGVAELVDVRDGSRQTIAEGGLPIVLDVDQQLRAALLRRGPRGGRSIWHVDLSSGEERELRVGDSLGESDLGRISPDGTVAYLRSNAGRELYALFAVPLSGGAPRLMAERADAELEQLILSSDGHLAALLWNRAGQSECELLDLRSGSSRQLLLPEPYAHGGSFSHDARWLAMTLEGPTHPRAVHVLDTVSGAWRRVTAQPLSWTQPTATPQLVKLRGEGDLELTAWLYRAAPEASPAAAVIHLHGGPEAQERPSYNPLFQALVQRGISVLAPNVRGSSGFGKTFVNADNGELRFGAIGDVAACARYLFDERLATPETLGCAGRSYGGYLTLASLVFHPELFAAGLDVCGMSDLATFYRDTEPWIAQAAYPKYGHPVQDAATLRRLSPLHHFGRLRAPLLVVHGENDSNVPLGEALQAVAAAEARGVPAELLLFRDEGHELAQRKNRELFVTRSVDFLEERLRGKRSPALLAPDDPPPFRVREGQPTSPFLLTCDHAGRTIPQSLGTLGLPEAELTRHIAWDIGAAQLAERLSAKLGAFLILQTYSRLVIDCNRPLDAKSSIAELSEATVVPGNQGITAEEAERRASAIFRPYHARLEREILRRHRLGTPTIFVAVHSFTPRYLNVDRPMHAGVLYGKDARFAHQVLARLRADGRWVVGDNEPYRVSEATDYGVIHHAERRGIPYVELEIRQDLIAESAGQSEWADFLADVLVDAART
ncbi:MAG: Dipeptidylaminopeptidase/acylaminoacyl-peptidase -like protein [Polyangiaceae bacterium]|jgi:predicted N-formylglutamate amidohydrolase/dipeptidyl aminopeptidase/acylaminoacyl peptidase|nr:Dipeptidylaminopeptidase/acylaminoacyl-peptidase -like protein [Polyangiaceae bacterium]